MATSTGSNKYSIRENSGGSTSFGDIVALGGVSFGGATAGASGVGAGGSAGAVTAEYLQVQRGDIIPVIIGAGGSVTGAFKSLDFDFSYDHLSGGYGTLMAASSSATVLVGGFGGSNGTPYGGGGGSAGAAVGIAGSYPGVGAANASFGEGGQLTTSHKVNLGGAGGNGAVILEYADPQKKA